MFKVKWPFAPKETDTYDGTPPSQDAYNQQLTAQYGQLACQQPAMNSALTSGCSSGTNQVGNVITYQGQALTFVPYYRSQEDIEKFALETFLAAPCEVREAYLMKLKVDKLSNDMCSNSMLFFGNTPISIDKLEQAHLDDLAERVLLLEPGLIKDEEDKE